MAVAFPLLLAGNVPMFFLFWTGIGLVIVATCIFYVILGEVNGKLPEQEQISMWVVNDKVFDILRKHADFYPRSNKRKQMIVVAIFAFALFVAFAALW